MFAAVLYPGDDIVSAQRAPDPGYYIKAAGPLYDAGNFGRMKRHMIGGYSPRVSLLVLTETELIAWSAKIDPYDYSDNGPRVHGQLAKVEDQLARWNRSDVFIERSFTPMELRGGILGGGKGNVYTWDKVVFRITNRALGQTSVMCAHVKEELDRSRAWTDRSVLAGDWTTDFSCFASWWADNPDATISA